MLTQSTTEIRYTSTRWRAVANGMLVLFFAALLLVPAVTMIAYDGWQDAGVFAVFAMPAAGLVALAILGGFRKALQPDELAITTEGLSLTHFTVVQRYPWAWLSEPIVVPRGKGSAALKLTVSKDYSPIVFVPEDFGSYFTELKEVMAAARDGRLIDVAPIHAKLAKDERQIATVLLCTFGIPIVVMFGVALFGPTVHRSAAIHHLDRPVAR